ncbi:MAG: septum site-determining protein MinD [Ruminococcaceae bacterium]|nr:septum site-determining protein MinD [Oscillospiraceae bacterium]
MGKILFVASYKGGVGKTTVSAGISASLAALGKRVLVIDGDFHMRCMDLVLNSESDFIFDALDVLLGRCTADEAIIKNCGVNNLDFLPAPLIYGDDQPALDNADELMAELKDNYDFIIVDSGADTPGIYDAFAEFADEGIIVTFQQATAIRAAEVTAGKLSALGLESIRLVVNSYRNKGVRKKILPDVFESVTRAGIPLLGVIPYDPRIIEFQEKGILPFTQKKFFINSFEAAFGNIAMRVLGDKIPLFKNVGNFTLRRKYVSPKVNEIFEEKIYDLQNQDFESQDSSSGSEN